MDKTYVNGHWHFVLNKLGIDVAENPGIHTSCPICGKGSSGDRFRFDDRENRGTWICNACGAGDGWSLVQKSLNIDFMQAMKAIEDVLNIKFDRKGQNKKDSTQLVRSMLLGLWNQSSPIRKNDFVWNYLTGRKLDITGVYDLLRCDQCYCKQVGGNLNAMVGVVRDRNGKSIAMHRTYIQNDKKANLESPKMLTPGIRKLQGCAIRLFPPLGSMIGIAEGVETAIAAQNIFQIPTWATISTKIMESFEPPEGIDTVVIFGDNDKNFQGQASAYKLASKISSKCKVHVKLPTYKDWNDQLCAEGVPQ